MRDWVTVVRFVPFVAACGEGGGGAVCRHVGQRDLEIVSLLRVCPCVWWASTAWGGGSVGCMRRRLRGHPAAEPLEAAARSSQVTFATPRLRARWLEGVSLWLVPERRRIWVASRVGGGIGPRADEAVRVRGK